MRPTLTNLHFILDGHTTNRLPLHPHQIADIRLWLRTAPRKDVKAFVAEMVPALWEDRSDDVHKLVRHFVRAGQLHDAEQPPE